MLENLARAFSRAEGTHSRDEQDWMTGGLILAEIWNLRCFRLDPCRPPAPGRWSRVLVLWCAAPVRWVVVLVSYGLGRYDDM